MGKFRSKLKRHGKGKTWSKGQSAVSNPDQMKHRLKAKSRFFQPNLSLAAATPTGLTMEAVHKHEQRQAYNAETTTVNDVAGSLMSFNLNDDDDEGMSGTGTAPSGTAQTFKTFASNYTSCSNMSFKKLLTGFRASSDLHKEMLAILSALTEIIREKGGGETSTEYFLLLMEQIEAAQEERDIIAGVSLLSMGIKSVPAPVLRRRFGQTAATLQALLQRFIETSNQSVMRYIVGCLSVLLRAQEYATWTYSSTFQYFDALLAFSIHSKPKIRKAAQHAVVSIIHGSCFMLPPVKANADEEDLSEKKDQEQPKVKHHPASSRVTKFCLAQFKPEVLANAQTTVLYTLALLKDTLSGFRTEDIRNVCEHLLSIMTAANVLVRTNCFQVLHALFLTRSPNLNASLCAKLLAAIHEYRPDRSDVRQMLAWITVLKEGHLHLAALQLDLCMQALPRLVDVCTTDLWLSDRTELVVGVSNCIKELLQDCVATACSSTDPEAVQRNRPNVARIIESMHKVLNAPFGEISKYVILIFSIVFEACGKQFGKELTPSLLTIAKRYDTQSSNRLQIEHTLISAIKALGPELVLTAIPLADPKSGGMQMERTWLLPLLREGANGASLQFFKEKIMPLALDCQVKWQDKSSPTSAHIYELLCCQLWGLFPGFCRQPRDPEYLRHLAPTLGAALEKNPELRAPIYDGLMELLDESQSRECHQAIGMYAKNFLPRLFNIYTQKPNGTYEADQRKRALDVIRLYISRSPTDVQLQLFETAQGQLASSAVASFEYDALFDINAAIVRVQKCRNIEAYFEKYMAPILRNDKSKLVAKDEQKLKKQQRKTYELLRELMTSDQASCQKFTRKNSQVLQQILQDAFNTSCSVCQASRLYCLKSLMDCRNNLAYNDQLVTKAIPEAVLNYKDFSTRKESVAEQLIKFIAQLYQDAGQINDFVDILTAGFTGDESLVTNTILAFRAVIQQQGQHLTVATLEFVLQQVSVFLVQKSRNQSEAAVAFLITYIKVMPIPLVSNHMETIMRSLSAMTKDTKRYCRIQIGYFLKKLCKRFTTEELARFVPGDDEITHRRLKKIRKQMRRDTRKKLNEEAQADSSDEELVGGNLEQKSYTIDDILADSDSDLPEDEMDAEDAEGSGAGKRRNKTKQPKKSTYIREEPDEIVDLADLKSIGNVLTSGSAAQTVAAAKSLKQKPQLPNGGFKTADDGRLIISDKALRGQGGGDSDSSDDSDDASMEDDSKEPKAKRGMEEDSSDEEELQHQSVGAGAKRKRKASDALSMKSGKTTASSRYTAAGGGKGIHRQLGGAGNTDAMSMKSGKSGKSVNRTAGNEYTSKKAKGDMKKRGQLDPYAYIPLTRNTLNKRKRSMNSRKFKSVLRGAGAETNGGGGGRVSKKYK
ncbi:RRP12-like protein [Drosophila serrata]|uniref:RRP12-like protein n=1 Tax=Drosophila serrata TaxID=7274 RepID=UPI000A1D39BA|nr:RRP12-like protein [Drosophila serrata]